MLKFIKDIFKGIANLKETTEELSGTRRVSSQAADMIKEYEGFSEKAYQDVVGVWTIGYGSTYYEDDTKVRRGDTITRAQANKLFDTVLQTFADEVSDAIKVNLNDCQFGALVSLAYNIGVKAFKRSTLLKKVNADPNDKNIALEFGKWVRANNKISNGLVRRRKKESDYYFSSNC